MITGHALINPWALTITSAIAGHLFCCGWPENNFIGQRLTPPPCSPSSCYSWVVLDTETRDLVSVHTDGNEIISNVKYSPGTVVYLPLVVCIGTDLTVKGKPYSVFYGHP